MESLDTKLEDLGYPLDRLAPEGLLVEGLVIEADIIYASGHVPYNGNQITCVGKVPSQVSQAEAKAAAALCAANVLRTVRQAIGSLDNIARILRITGYVNSDPDFTDQHLVIDGASELVREVFGEQGRHSRTALGMAQLPLGSAVEVEMILKRRGMAAGAN